ncbi:hypothetical protein GCM10009676_26280 [Prauserella halophila]|uniref:HNH nuclease domain-containing protein n=1 Tax=Prauserella halophila TaxID=185641 RepID=A0ABN1W8N2_9PSEU|nr:HNH endonuclease signature motif containing protein [Prauserella halophila]MCP2235003.1 protein of unknown function (DUF222) [Prauserella halophila]
MDVPAESAAAVKSHIDALARKLRGEDRHGRTLDQLRADVATDLLLGRSPGVTTPETAAAVHLHLPVDTVLTITDDGCELDGYGPVPGPIARDIMTNPHSTWRAVLCDLGTGRPIDLGRTRRHPTALVRDLVAVRDRECCVPWCHRPARQCDFDHNTPWADGGGTATVNGSPTCDHHHSRKDDLAWRIEHDSDTGVTTVTTSNGAVHTTAPEPIHHPTRRRPARSGPERRAPRALMKRRHPQQGPEPVGAEPAATQPPTFDDRTTGPDGSQGTQSGHAVRAA